MVTAGMSDHLAYSQDERQAISDRLTARARLAVSRADYVQATRGPRVSYWMYSRMAIGYCELAQLVLQDFSLD